MIRGQHKVPPPRTGFTLIELLVAITILMILATITFTMVNAAMKGDQIRSAARQVQSYVEGARDRAIHANDARGVRFLIDQTNTSTCTSMVFIAAPGKYNDNGFTIGTVGGDKRILSGTSAWDELEERGLIASGQPITISANFYTIVKGHYPTSSDPITWYLTKDYGGSGSPPWSINTTDYSIQLNSAVLPNQEPRVLPKGIAIDLRQSYLYGRLPGFWYTVTNNGGTPDDTSSDTALAASRADDTVVFSPRMDLLMSPRGTVTGLLASAGSLHLVLAEIQDIERGLGLVDVDTNGNSTIDENEHNLGDKLIMTVTTQTGKVSTHPVYTDSTDYFRYAETGEEAK